MFCCTCEKQSLNKYQWMCCVILIALLLVKTLTLASNPTVSSAPGIQFPPCHSSQHYRTRQSGRWRLAAEETCCSVNKSYLKLALSNILAQHFLKIVVAWWEYQGSYTFLPTNFHDFSMTFPWLLWQFPWPNFTLFYNKNKNLFKLS